MQMQGKAAVGQGKAVQIQGKAAPYLTGKTLTSALGPSTCDATDRTYLVACGRNRRQCNLAAVQP